MSGLAARFHRDGRPVEASSIWAMLDAIPYRGPDGMWVHAWDTAGLGYAKLAITPEEVDEQQPLISPRTGVALIADVRLDNRDDLFDRLPDPLPRTVSDAELILHAYEAWGPDAIGELLGDFALMLWDPRQRRMLCARDTSGQRALFYRLDTQTFAAASEIHQLLQDPDVAIRPSDDRILSFLTPQNIFQTEKQEHQTFYDGIFLLPAGHCLCVDVDAVSLAPYWAFEPDTIRYRSDAEYAEHFRELFSEVVRCRMRSTHPIGITLSGGLDSSSIACTAQQLFERGEVSDQSFASFSFVFKGMDCDETPYIEALRARYGFAAHYVSPGTYQGRLRSDPTGFQEGPNVGIRQSVATLYDTIQAQGTRVLLTGDVADACMGGSPLVFDSLLRQGRFREFSMRMQHYRPESESSTRRLIALFCVAPLLPLPLQKQIMIWQTRRSVVPGKHLLLPGWMPEPLRQQLADRAVEAAIAREQSRQFSNQTLHHEFGMIHPPQIARYPAPWSFDVRRPFADQRLLRFMMGIPPEQKYRPHPESDEYYAGSKWLLRRAMAGIVPDQVRLRTHKTTFESVYVNEFEHNWPDYEAIFHPSARSEIAERGLIDPDRFWTRLQELRRQPSGKDVQYVMQLIGTETWLRTLRLPRPALTAVSPALGQLGALTGGR